jgi:hypothetical protein
VPISDIFVVAEEATHEQVDTFLFTDSTYNTEDRLLPCVLCDIRETNSSKKNRALIITGLVPNIKPHVYKRKLIGYCLTGHSENLCNSQEFSH